MEYVLDFFKGFSPTQIALLGVGLFLVWPYIAQFFQKVVPSSPDNVPVLPVVDQSKFCISQTVYEWEKLRNQLELCELTQASDKLDEVFPLLIPQKTKPIKASK